MIDKTTYQGAQAVSAAIETHLHHYQAMARQHGEQELAPIPPIAALEIIIDIAFWASLRREEGRSPKISLAYLSPEQAKQPVLFGQRLPLTPDALTKLAPAVERPGIHLGVWGEGDNLYVWGATRTVPAVCFVLEVVEPGLLVIKHRRSDGFGKFANVAVLKGDQIKVVDEDSASLPDCPELITLLLGFTSPATRNNTTNVLVQIAVSMRDHGRGGTLLVVPANTRTWRDSIIHPIPYAIAPAYAGLASLMQQEASKRSKNSWQGALRASVEGIAGLTAVDGATIITDQYELLAFGAKIGRPDGNAAVQQMVVTEPVVGNKATFIHPARNGGTRHLSAAQFVHDQREAFALVASQDGRFTIFSWSPCEGMVHAHRVDTLLL